MLVKSAVMPDNLKKSYRANKHILPLRFQNKVNILEFLHSQKLNSLEKNVIHFSPHTTV